MQLSKSKKQIIYLYFCTFTGMGIGVLVSIMNTHFLNPQDYGDVRYVNNLIGFFAGIFLVGYFVSGSRLLAIAKDQEEVKRIKGGMVTIISLITIAMMFVMCLLALYNWYIGKSIYHLFLWVIPFCSNALLLNYINTSSQGDNSIGTIGLARLLPSTCYLILGYVIYSLCGANSTRMILLQNGVAMIILTILIIRNGFSLVNIKDTFRKLTEENKKYGLQVYYGSLANVSVQYIAGICLGAFGTDNSNVGFYSLALTISLPLATLPSIVGTTYFKKFANQDIIDKKVITSTFAVSLVSLSAFVFLIFPVVAFLYTKDYSCIAYYASFLAIGSTFHGIGDVFNRFLGAHGQGAMLRNGAFISGAIALTGYTVGIKMFGIEGAVITRILSSLAYFACMIYYYRVYIKKKIIWQPK